jgi:hypothetical protein
MKLDAQQDRLLARIFASRQFSYADSLKRVLQYICEHASDPKNPSLKEYEIATCALGRPASFDPKVDPVVRVSMTEIRNRLRTFFAGEGASEPLRLSIPKGQYRAVFELAGREGAPPQPVPASSNLLRFWEPYLSPSNSNLALYTEPLFFRDESRAAYIRNLYVNDQNGVAELRRRVPECAVMALDPCYHYLSRGEVNCVFCLSRTFQELGAPLEMRNARVCFWNEIRLSNLILLGCARTNTFMDSLQGGSEIAITEDAIEIANPRGGEQKRYRSRRYLDGKLQRYTDYALISRRPGLSGNTAVTIIAANHGNAVEGAGQYLSTENHVEELLCRMGLAGNGLLPPHFEVVMRVEMIDVDDEVVSAEYVTHRIVAG